MQACDGCARAWTKLAAILGWSLLMCSSCAAGFSPKDPDLPWLCYQPWGRQVAHQSPWQLVSQWKKSQPAEENCWSNCLTCHVFCRCGRLVLVKRRVGHLLSAEVRFKLEGILLPLPPNVHNISSCVGDYPQRQQQQTNAEKE